MANYKTIQKPRLENKIKELVRTIDENVTTKNKLTPAQIHLIAVKWYREFPVESLEDIGVFADQVISGHYRKDFNFLGLDAPTLFNWFRQYLEEKYEKKEEDYRIAQHQQKIDEEARFIESLSEETLKLRAELFKKFNQPQRISQPTPVNTNAYIPKKTKEQIDAEQKLIQQDQSILMQLKDMDFTDTSKEDIRGYINELMAIRADDSVDYLRKILNGEEGESDSLPASHPQ